MKNIKWGFIGCGDVVEKKAVLPFPKWKDPVLLL